MLMAHACNSSKQPPNRHAREDRREERNDHSKEQSYGSFLMIHVLKWIRDMLYTPCWQYGTVISLHAAMRQWSLVHSLLSPLQFESQIHRCAMYQHVDLNRIMLHRVLDEGTPVVSSRFKSCCVDILQPAQH